MNKPSGNVEKGQNIKIALEIQQEIKNFLQNLITALTDVLDPKTLDLLKQRLESVEQKIETLVTMIRTSVEQVTASSSQEESASTDNEAQIAGEAESDTDNVQQGAESVPNGVHPKIYTAFVPLLPGKSLEQIFNRYQQLRSLPKNYYLEHKPDEATMREHLEVYLLGWLISSNNLDIHAHTDNQLKNQILGKMHPALRTLRFDDNSAYEMAIFANIWKEKQFRELRKKLHEIRDAIHDDEATH